MSGIKASYPRSVLLNWKVGRIQVQSVAVVLIAMQHLPTDSGSPHFLGLVSDQKQRKSTNSSAQQAGARLCLSVSQHHFFLVLLGGVAVTTIIN